jgi:hypothetical protein
MEKVREKKSQERKDINRRIDRQGGAIQELPPMSKEKSRRRK